METQRELKADFSTLVLSLATQAAMAMGLAPNPMTNETEKDLKMACFNIDLLLMLKERTQNNLSEGEAKFLESVIGDLQSKYLQLGKA